MDAVGLSAPAKCYLYTCTPRRMYLPGERIPCRFRPCSPSPLEPPESTSWTNEKKNYSNINVGVIERCVRLLSPGRHLPAQRPAMPSKSTPPQHGHAECRGPLGSRSDGYRPYDRAYRPQHRAKRPSQ